MTPQIIGLCLLAFFSGALPFGYWAGRLKGIDLREHGSKNIGATNVLRTLGPLWGCTVLALDALKGYLPVLAAQRIGLDSWWVVAIGIAAILGHSFSPLVNFKGGKGVATALGVVIGFSWQAAAIASVIFVITVAVTRYVSLGSLLAAVTVAILFWLLPASLLPDPVPYRLFGIAVAVFIIMRHRANIERIRQGTESRFGEKKATPVTEETEDNDE